MKSLPTLLVVVLALQAAACDVQTVELGKMGDGSDTPSIPLDDLDGAEVQTVEGSGLCEDDELSLAFAQDKQLFVVELELEAGARITVETHGEAPTDPVLVLHRPVAGGDEGYEAEPVASDDDAGVGFHARLDKVDIDRSGRWLLGLTSYGGASVGEVGLTVQLVGGELCADDDAEVCCLTNPSAPARDGAYELLTLEGCLDGGGAEVAEAFCSDEIGCCALGDASGEVTISACAQAGGDVVDGAACDGVAAEEELCCSLPSTSLEMTFGDCVASLGEPDAEACDDEDGETGTPDEETSTDEEEDGDHDDED